MRLLVTNAVIIYLSCDRTKSTLWSWFALSSSENRSIYLLNRTRWVMHEGCSSWDDLCTLHNHTCFPQAALSELESHIFEEHERCEQQLEAVRMRLEAQATEVYTTLNCVYLYMYLSSSYFAFQKSSSERHLLPGCREASRKKPSKTRSWKRFALLTRSLLAQASTAVYCCSLIHW